MKFVGKTHGRVDKLLESGNSEREFRVMEDNEQAMSPKM